MAVMEFSYMALGVGVSVSVLGLAWYYLRQSDYHTKLAAIPGPTGLPIFGNAFQLKSDTIEFFRQIHQLCDTYNNKGIFRLAIGRKAVLFVFHADKAEKVLLSLKNLSKAESYDYIHAWLGTGLLTSQGEKWQKRRKLLTPTFHFKILLGFLDIFNAHCKVLVEILERQCDEGPIDIFHVIQMCTLDIICETAMGKKMGIMKAGGETEYMKAVSGMAHLLMTRYRNPLEWFDVIYKLTERGRRHDKYLKTLHDFTQQVIDERRQEMAENPEWFSEEEKEEEEGSRSTRCRAFLDLLLHMSKEANFTNQDIREEVDTFMFEGHDTTACALGWVIQAIGTYPEVQKKLHEEMDEVFGSSDRACTMEDMSRLKYLECVIKESLRLYPSVQLVGRAVDEDIDIGELIIPKGTSVNVLITRINRDPKFFSDPDKFNPDHFLLENSTGRHPFAYIPFSAGPRNCIGQKFAMNEEKCILSALLRKFHIKALQTIEEIKPTPELVLRPSKGISIKLSRRA